ncbi:3'-5' exonuclease [Agathobaculum sp.]|uniref:3'-5' exonuclease n=1 Tax=Agathobaculum sp. TaxID=2048138 RepID=UPI002A83FCB2|nr:3'-5' exonuclease [Agathobaculum sp.]MDY3618679.1 3'-5' exonuclease [Agathobaculum sp.]
MKYMAIDFETGNASPLSACSIGVAVFEDGGPVESEAYLIRPPDEVGRFHWGNIRVHGIKERMVADAPPFDLVWRHIARRADGGVLVAHNAMFDTAVLCACLSYYRMPMPDCDYLCTVKVAQRVWPDLPNHKLNTVSEALGIALNHHEAGSDARASGLILQAALRETGSADAAQLAEKIGMRLGRISCAGKTACSIAKTGRTPAKHV